MIDALAGQIKEAFFPGIAGEEAGKIPTSAYSPAPVRAESEEGKQRPDQRAVGEARLHL